MDMKRKAFVIILLPFLALVFMATSSTARPPPRKAVEYIYTLNVTDPIVQNDGAFAISLYNKKASATAHLEFIRVVNASQVVVSQDIGRYHLLVTNLKLQAKNCSQPDHPAGLYLAVLYAENQTPPFLFYFMMVDNTNI